MATTQPGGFYLAPDGRPHDAWNRPVEEGVTVLSAPVDTAKQSPEAGLQPVGGMIDTPFPGSQQYRAHEARLRKQIEDTQKELERLAKEQEDLRKKVPMVLDLESLRAISAAIGHGAIPKSAAGAVPGPTRDDLREAGERWEEAEEQRLDKLAEKSLAVDTNQGEEAKLEKGGQTAGESEMAESKAEKKAGKSHKSEEK